MASERVGEEAGRAAPGATEITRAEYAARYGPTAGGRIRLGDTNLLALVERDETSYGDEVLTGWGKTFRTGLMASDAATAAIAGRTVHAYHVEGIGGGHAPDILAVAEVGNVIGSSSMPTIPCQSSTLLCWQQHEGQGESGFCDTVDRHECKVAVVETCDPAIRDRPLASDNLDVSCSEQGSCDC